MADTVGVSRSTVSRESIEASEAALQQLLERRFDDVELLIIYIDGMHFGDQCVLAAVGVDLQGRKHVLGLREGATENAEAAKDLRGSDAELAKRRASWKEPAPRFTRGYGALFSKHITQADKGCDFDFLEGTAPTPEPEIH